MQAVPRISAMTARRGRGLLILVVEVRQEGTGRYWLGVNDVPIDGTAGGRRRIISLGFRSTPFAESRCARIFSCVFWLGIFASATNRNGVNLNRESGVRKSWGWIW